MHACIADVLADTAQNSIEAGASKIEVTLAEIGGRISVEIRDNGKGMDADTVARAFDPFYTEAGKHDKRKVGLGLPILRQICEATGGEVSLESEKGVGTVLKYCFDANHIDLPPMGDLPGVMITLFNYPGDFELVFTHKRGDEEYSISRIELSEAVGGLESVDSLALAKEFLISQEESL
jgi:anti-sigma regulatory factor (Ser/Thr protein kinase)